MAKLTRQEHAKRAIARNRELEIAANDIDLPSFLASSGYAVKQESQNGDYGLKGTSAGSFGLRFNGRVWLAFQNASGGFAGNAVQLIELLHSCDKKTAVHHILGDIKIKPSLADNSRAIARTKAVKEAVELGVQAPRPQHIAAGNAYLATRGIDVATFEAMRKAGNAEYAWNGLTFIGKKASGLPAMIETRLFDPLTLNNKPGKLLKHLVEKGSDRSFPVVIAGSNEKNIAIVEGNFDGMALYEMNKRSLQAGQQQTIIIAGGKDNNQIMGNPEIAALLSNAKNIIGWGDNEQVDIDDLDDPRLYPEVMATKQAESDASHQKRLNAIRAINAEAVIEYRRPPADKGDLADWNMELKANFVKAVAIRPKLKF